MLISKSGDWVKIVDIHPDDSLKKYEKQLKEGEFQISSIRKIFNDGYIRGLLIYKGIQPLFIKESLAIRYNYPVAFLRVKLKKID